MKKSTEKVVATFIYLIVAIVAVSFLSMTCSREEEEDTNTVTPPPSVQIDTLKVVDMLECTGIVLNGDDEATSTSMCYVLLENGEIRIMGQVDVHPYTDEQVKKIMAFRRGEAVEIAIIREE